MTVAIADATSTSTVSTTITEPKTIPVIAPPLKGGLGEGFKFCKLVDVELDVDVDVGDIDVVVGVVNVAVEDIDEERFGLERLSLLVPNDEAEFSGKFEAVGAPVKMGVVETDLRDPGEDTRGVGVVTVTAAFEAGKQ